MSTYNGEAYLEQQVNSILKQTFTNWQLLIRDDGSTDKTVELIKQFEKQYPEKIRQVDHANGGGSSKSFMGMLSLMNAPYGMFCDQDDFWESNKIALSLEKLKALEQKDPVALVFTDMEVVSEDLKEERGSFLALQRLNPNWINNPNNLLAQSIAAGCTMIFTSHLVKLVKPISAPLFQHDHWLLINAAIYGYVGYCEERTVRYRQHSYNTIGSHEINWAYFSKKIKEISKVIRRWIYIKFSFSRKVNVLNLFFAKLKVNLARL
jgi:glycosyltransferase involved in cell wall biosynthesis